MLSAFRAFQGLLGRKASKPTQTEPSSSQKPPKPRQFTMKQAPKLKPKQMDKTIGSWMTDNDNHDLIDDMNERYLDTHLRDPDFVEECFKGLVAARGANEQITESMMQIKYETKVALVRHSLKAKHNQDVPTLDLIAYNEDKENQMVQPYQEASLFIPAKSLAEPQQLKRKRSSLSLHRVKSFTELKRQKLREALRARDKKHAEENDSQSTHSSIAVSDTNIRPRSAGQSIKDFFTGSLRHRPADNQNINTLAVIAKADDEDEIATQQNSPMYQLYTRSSVYSVNEAKKTAPDQRGKFNNELISNSKDEELEAEAPGIVGALPTWNQKTDTIIASSVHDHTKAQSDNFVHALRYMRQYFTPGLEPEQENLGSLDFEETLRQMLMFVRCESAFGVRHIANEAMDSIIATITALANKEYRPMQETKTLRALLSILLVLVKLPFGTGMIRDNHEEIEKWHSASYEPCALMHDDTVEFDNMLKALIGMKFSHGEERRGFSNFRDRRLVIELMCAWVKGPTKLWITHSGTQEQRARKCLNLFRDPEDSASHDFINAMHERRPYTRWYNELRKSTEGFGGVGWIWHNRGNKLKLRDVSKGTTFNSYYEEFKPIEKPRPDETCSTVRSHTETLVTCYIASTIDFLTTLISSLSEPEERQARRLEFQNSRFDEIFLSRFVKASTTNFPVVHEALTYWYTAARADDPNCQV